ncbi:MAG: hypothetical protein IPP90_03460 [Gemmatimonadaceae bacterium]|nr:hypothetical protein [Gemmatimonadaceae bacterium]
MRRILVGTCLAFVSSSVVTAQAGAPAVAPPLPGPAVRRIESAQAISKEPLGAITNVRHLSDGRVLLNDGTRRRLLMLDSTLTQVTVVLDSLTEVQNAYGTRAGAMLAYRGDSTVFIDPATLAMLFLDGAGNIVRVRAVPRAQDINGITNPAFQAGVPGFDARGRFIYRIAATAAPPAVAPPPGMPYFPSPPDSAFVVAVNLDSRKSDTLGVVRIPRQVYSLRMDQEFGFSINMVPNPLPLTDDWALLSEGSVAFLRGIDYRVDFRAPDGTLTSSDKLPFPWVRLTEDDKVRFADSAKAVQIKNAQTDFATQMVAWSNLLNKPYPATFTPPEGYVPPAGLPKDWILPKGVSFPGNYVPACPPGTPPPAPSGTGPPSCTQTYFSEMYGSGYTPPAPTYRAPTLVRPRDLPDYKPPVGTSAVRADADGNLWVRTILMRPSPGGVIYDLINRKGELFDRIQLPTGYQLVGFGQGKLVYLSNRDATGLHLSRVRLK